MLPCQCRTRRGGREGESYVVDAPVGLADAVALAAVADQAVGPHPLDVLHGAAGLREHDVAQAGIVGRGGAVGDGEVAPRVVAGQEDGDVVDLGGAALGVGREGEAAVGGDVEGDFDEVWRVLGGVCDREGVRDRPPPRGVPGCGASTITRPGV